MRSCIKGSQSLRTTDLSVRKIMLPPGSLFKACLGLELQFS